MVVAEKNQIDGLLDKFDGNKSLQRRINIIVTRLLKISIGCHSFKILTKRHQFLTTHPDYFVFIIINIPYENMIVAPSFKKCMHEQLGMAIDLLPGKKKCKKSAEI